MTSTDTASDNLKLSLFALTLFLSAALMFALQPMLGRMLLPLAGGTPSGWIVALAFFQVMLLAGYLLAHLLSRFEPRVQCLLYLACLAAGVFFLPPGLSVFAAGQTPGPVQVFLMLAAAAAAPFIALSAGASSLQRLFAATGHPSASDPYFLYAASNLGSFAGLLLYPFLIEPLSTLTGQSRGWSIGYLLLIAAAALCLLRSWKSAPGLTPAAEPAAPAGRRERLEWFTLALLPSALLLGVTAHITTDVSSAPFIWVLPLGVYLLTYAAAFAKRPPVPYGPLLKIQPPAAAVILVFTLLAKNAMGIWPETAAHLAAFAVAALMCHMRLARGRPAGRPGRLTAFYLMIAAGGAAGGLLGAFIAPLCFTSPAEYPLLMLASVLLNQDIGTRLSRRYLSPMIAAYALMLLLFPLCAWKGTPPAVFGVLLAAIIGLLTLHPKAALAGGLLLFGIVLREGRLHPDVLATRNFYGIIRVFDRTERPADGKKLTVRYMQHGRTLHGSQILDGAWEKVPTSYFTREGPLNDALSLVKPESIAAVGLGPGTLNCYAGPGRTITFFELDPAVVKAAKEAFTYLSKCGNGMPRIVTGDARLELRREEGRFDMLILDAFSSDTVPTHLLTREALGIYLRRLGPDGVILLHVSNKYFRLEIPVAATAGTLGLRNFAAAPRFLPQFYARPSRWIALARSEGTLLPLARAGWKPVAPPPGTKPWTDDYADLLGSLRLTGPGRGDAAPERR